MATPTDENVRTQLYTIAQVSEILQVSFYTVNNYIKDGKLKTVSFGRSGRPRKRVSAEELDRFIGEGNSGGS